MKFKQFLTERFVNALPDDIEVKEKYKQRVWNLLQSSCAAGGKLC